MNLSLEQQNLPNLNNSEKIHFLKIVSGTFGTITKSLMCVSLESQKEKKESWTEKLFKEIAAETFPNLAKDINLQIQETKLISNRIKSHNSYQDTSLLNFKEIKITISLKKPHCIYALCLVTQPCLSLCDPMDCSPPGSSVQGIFQARILEWVAIPSSRGSSQTRDGTQVSHIAGRFFTIWATREIL